MKLIAEYDLLPEGESLKAVRYRVPYFRIPWHYHEEFELVYILAGQGTRHIGGNRSDFSAGDCVLTGPDLPHIWLNSRDYLSDYSNLFAEAYVLQFGKSLLDSLFGLKELDEIRDMLYDANGGLYFPGAREEGISEGIEAIINSSGSRRITAFIELMGHLAEIRDRCVLNAVEQYGERDEQSDRMRRVQRFFLENYTRTISLWEAAAAANMSSEAFARFYKRESGETMTQSLNRLRISNARHLLQQGDLSISQVAFESGFRNFSYFYRVFRKMTGMTPGKYRIK